MLFSLLAVALTIGCMICGPALAATANSSREAARVDRLFQPWENATSPGCAVAVMKGGQVVYERGFGMADLDHDVKITPTTVFHVGSIAKQFTAAAILMLARDNRISLDDPIRKYVPEVPDFGTPITVRQLLHHTSGLRDWEELLVFDGWRIYGDVVTDADVLAVISRQKELNFPPGSEFLYSNTGYTLLAQVVARVSGQSLAEFTATRIFGPLGMRQTHFRADHAEVVKDLAFGYCDAGGSFSRDDPNLDTVGPTNLLTTVEDLARWDLNFYTGQVGGAQLVKQMVECGKLNNGTQLVYGSGLFVGPGCAQKTAAAEHSGSDAGYAADMIRFPPQHLAVATLCNLSSIDVMGLTHQAAEIYGAKLPAPPPETRAAPSVPARPTPSAAQLREFAGTYRSQEIEIPYYVTADENRLTIHALKIGAVPMLPVATDEFSCTNSEPSNVQAWRVRFTRNARGHVSGFLINTNYFTRNLRFEKPRQ